MRVALGIVVGVVIVLVSFTLVVHGLSMATSTETSYNFYSANSGLNEFKTKMAEIIGSANQEEENSANVENQETASGLNAFVPGANSSELNPSEINSSAEQSELASPQNSSQNSSFVNQSLENRTSGVGPGNNSTSRTGSDSGGSMLSQSDSISPSGIHLDNQASFDGDWSMQAGKQGFGNSGINDRMALSGDFNVHKSVSFKG
jgi:hypothetical protein